MSTEKSPHIQSATRRKFLLAAGNRRGAVAMPQVSRAQTVTWKYQSTWPTKDIFHEFAADYRQEGQRHDRRPAQARRARGRRGRARLPAAGCGVIPACSTAATAYRLLVRQAQGRSRCSARRPGLRAGTPTACSAWFYYGGGEALYNELSTTSSKLNVVSSCTTRCRPSRSAGSRSRSPAPKTSRA